MVFPSTSPPGRALACADQSDPRYTWPRDNWIVDHAGTVTRTRVTTTLGRCYDYDNGRWVRFATAIDGGVTGYWRTERLASIGHQTYLATLLADMSVAHPNGPPADPRIHGDPLREFGPAAPGLCVACGDTLGGSPSDFYCDDECQWIWRGWLIPRDRYVLTTGCPPAVVKRYVSTPSCPPAVVR